MGEYANSRLPPGWSWATLEDVSKLCSGNPAPQGPENFDEGGLPFVRVQDMGRLGSRVKILDTKDHVTEDAARQLKLFPAGAVLFTKSGASTLLNQRAILYQPMYVVSHIAAAIPEDGVLSEWLYFWLSRVDFSQFTHATTLPSLPLSKIKAMTVPVAPTAEQILISDTIDELYSNLDAGVAALERARDKLKLYRASVLKAAVEGALTADWRAEHTDIDPPGETRREEPAAPDTDAAPRLPEGWRRAFLEDVATVVAGNPAPQGAGNFDEGGVPFVRVQDMGRLGARARMSGTRDRLTENAARNLRLFPAGTVLFTKSGASTLLNQRAILDRPMHVVSHIAAAIPEDGVLSEWLYFCLSCVDFARYTHATTLPSLPLSKVRRILIPLAPAAEQHAIVEAVEEQLCVVDRLEADIDAKLAAAGALRQAVLRDAFAGKLAPQDPDDEPASALLGRIAAEREARARDAAAARRRSSPRRKREHAAAP